MAKICRKAIVSGRVQGVYFRGATQEQACVLGIVGYARNLADGNVEVLMCGDAKQVEALIAWLHKGPPMSKVDGVVVEELALLDIQGFDVK